MKANKFFCAIFFVVLNFFSSAEQIVFSSDSMKGNASGKNNSTLLSGNAKVVTETMEISADEIEISGKNFRFIKASGGVKGKNTKSNFDFTCENLSYDRETKIASLENNVTLRDAENDFFSKAQIIEYNQETEICVMQIQVDISQKENKCTSAFAIYKKNEKLLEMKGNSKIVQNDDTFRAQNITLNLDTQEIFLEERVKGSVSASEKKSGEKNPDAENSAESETEKIGGENGRE